MSLQTHQNTHQDAASIIHFLANLPPKPYCSDDLRRLNIRPAKTAIKYAYIQPNDPYNVRCVVFDMDLGAYSFHQFEDKMTATPNIIVQNPENLNCHYIYLLKTPVWVKDTGKQAPQAYLNAVKGAMTRQLGADTRYSGLICKNPLSREWRTTELHSHLHSLDDLGKYVDLSLPSIEKDRAKAEKGLIDVVINGRNDHLFTVLRLFAYERIASYKEHEGLVTDSSKLFRMWHNAIEKEAMRINTAFPSVLGIGEIKSTAKSVSRWVWKHYQEGEQVQRGKMGFGETRHNFNFTAPMLPEEERKRRQSLSAQLTNKHRKESTELKIKQAIERLKANGEKVTKTGVAKSTGLARSKIVENYGFLFD
jgi:hypothetical protein